MFNKHIALTNRQQHHRSNSLTVARPWSAAVVVILLAMLLLKTQNAMAVDSVKPEQVQDSYSTTTTSANNKQSIVLARLVSIPMESGVLRHSVNFPKTSVGPDPLWLLCFISLILAWGSYAMSQIVVDRRKD